jgi:predicted pyridoxine 5'-phosphate oxidase superfamily flavin-nucleotide-binding protein
MTDTEHAPITIAEIQRCFGGAVPAVIATASADGTPNITYLSRVHAVDDERVAISNQFFSKTARNLAENPRAQLLLVDPVNHDEYRLVLEYERTERRGKVFEKLRADVDAIAALTGMQDVFKLRAADIYRVVDLRAIPRPAIDVTAHAQHTPDTAGLAELTARLSRCADLDTLVGTTVDGLAEVLGYEHSMLLLLDEDGRRLYTIASHGYEAQGVGSEVVIGDGPIGMAALHCRPMRIGNARQMRKYALGVRRSFEQAGTMGPGIEIPVPGLDDADSRLAVPALALGQLVGVLVVEARHTLAYDEVDESVLSVVATLVANAIETIRAEERSGPAARAERAAGAPAHPQAGAPRTHVRHYAVDGSTFIDGDYLIKGVAGRILWSLLQQHEDEGRTEFSNREVRRDPTLEMPEVRDNLESRLILLKRRLDERDAPIRIEKTGRGRFRLDVDTDLRLDHVPS